MECLSKRLKKWKMTFEMESDYQRLIDKFASNSSKIDVINGLLLAQSLCSKVLKERYSPDVLRVMDNIVKMIDVIKENP